MGFIPNAADVEYYRPRPTDPPPDGRTVVYFGLFTPVPSVDGVIHFVQDIWPRIAQAHPEARCKIIGDRPPPSLLALAGPRVELTGFVVQLLLDLALFAAAVVVPLRLGGGTRLKIVEAMAMGKAIVSTTLGAEGIEAVPVPPRRGPAGGLRGRSEPPAGRARLGGAHRPVSEAAGGGAVFLERGCPGSGGLLPPDPCRSAREGSAHRSRADRAGAPLVPQRPCRAFQSAAVCDLFRAMRRPPPSGAGSKARFTDLPRHAVQTRLVVHITTPPTSPFRLAMDSEPAGAHVILREARHLKFGRAQDPSPARPRG